MDSTQHRLFCFIGLPCSGKSTVVKTVAEGLGNATIITAGDIAREITSRENTVLDMYKNDLCMNENAMRAEISKRINTASTGNVILDGIPRFKDQAEWLFTTYWHSNPILFQIVVGDNGVLFQRAQARARDERDTNYVQFYDRLHKASKNMTEVEQYAHFRFVPCYGIINDTQDRIMKQFARLTKGI